jgi:hypothetical protein
MASHNPKIQRAGRLRAKKVRVITVTIIRPTSSKSNATTIKRDNRIRSMEACMFIRSKLSVFSPRMSHLASNQHDDLAGERWTLDTPKWREPFRVLGRSKSVRSPAENGNSNGPAIAGTAPQIYQSKV